MKFDWDIDTYDNRFFQHLARCSDLTTYCLVWDRAGEQVRRKLKRSLPGGIRAGDHWSTSWVFFLFHHVPMMFDQSFDFVPYAI